MNTPTTWKDKVHPTNIGYPPNGKWCAIVAVIVGGEDWTMPNLEALTVTSDNMVLGVRGGFANAFLGALSDLRQNWTRFLDFAKLSDDEKREANEAFKRATGREP